MDFGNYRHSNGKPHFIAIHSVSVMRLHIYFFPILLKLLKFSYRNTEYILLVNLYYWNVQ